MGLIARLRRFADDRLQLRRVVRAALLLCLAIALWACAPDPANCRGIRGIPRAECQALVAFYQQTNGPAWKDHRGWLQSSQPCSWHGLQCADGHVDSISINYNELSGSLPTEISQLQELRTLSLYYNQLEGNLPPEIGNLANLETLILHNNQLGGVLPAELGEMSSLVKLDLDGNEFSGPMPAELGGLVNLEWLGLRDNRLSGSIPIELGNLTRLKRLYLSSNELSGDIPAVLGELSGLQVFSYYDNPQLAPPPASLQGLPTSDYDLLGWGEDE